MNISTRERKKEERNGDAKYDEKIATSEEIRRINI